MMYLNVNAVIQIVQLCYNSYTYAIHRGDLTQQVDWENVAKT